MMGFFDLFRDGRAPLVEQAFEDVKAMISNGHEMFAAAAAHLYDNEILDVDLEALDEGINQREQRVRRTVLQHLSHDPDRQLVFSLKLLSIVTEAERIGDLSKSLVEVAEMAHGPRLGPHVEPLRVLRDRVLQMFDRVEVGFFREDEAVAREHMRHHHQLKTDINAYLARLASHENLTLNEGIVFSMSARMMSRISSHLANISSAVVCSFDQIRTAPAWSEAGVD
jgi:Na+/phosphate symporter